MSRRSGLDVVVIGAGVVGAATALTLAAAGLRVGIVEAHEPAPWRADAPDLRVYAFAPDSSALLERLRLWHDIRGARTQPYRNMRVWDAAGGGELRFDADAVGREALGHIVEHGLLVDRLWQRVRADARIEVHCPDKLLALEQDETGVSLALQGGARLHARFALGADGAVSRVRDQLGIESDAHDYGQRGVVAYVSTELPHEQTAWQRFLPSGPLAFLPCADGRSSIVWTLSNDEAERVLALPDDGFCRELTRAFDARLGDVLEVSARAAFPLRRQLAKTMLLGRVALVGDAAHAVHPLAGQGVNLGLRDVSALDDSVREALQRGIDPFSPHRMQRWARARYSENAMAAYGFEAINRVFSNDALLPTLLRGHALGIAGRLPPLTRFLWKRAAGV
ncbi:FAD-dependent oxidoreductase [Arenimonas sp.]|uniref:FAD-dependent oxidoreductase n=1 Tax=Arenimonas sp. TaxID=1872635 RepID=UPI0039E4875A